MLLAFNLTTFITPNNKHFKDDPRSVQNPAAGEHWQSYEHLNKGELLCLLSLFKAVRKQA